MYLSYSINKIKQKTVLLKLLNICNITQDYNNSKYINSLNPSNETIMNDSDANNSFKSHIQIKRQCNETMGTTPHHTANAAR
jgi:hypothetical protein